MSESRKEIILVPAEQIYPHPDNPRKELGELEEMADSVKKNGIMQNLTIIPISALDEEAERQPEADKISLLSDFCVLIGHRRLAAAKKAGLEKVPCRIVSRISRKEQLGIMLEENMQRNDLTIYEQAQGFQMMLDLGETVETIAEKTGFSKTTVYHRVNLAKLDQKLLKEKESNASYQLTLKDLYELEQVKDIEERNRILRESYNSGQIAWKAQQAEAERVRKENEEKIVNLLKAAGVKKAPKGTNYWDRGWELVKEFDLDKEPPEEISLKGKYEKFYSRSCAYLYVLRKEEKTNKKSKEETEREEREKNKNTIKARIKALGKERKRFVEEVVNGRIPSGKCSLEELWKALLLAGGNAYKSRVLGFLAGKSMYECSEEEKTQAEEKLGKLDAEKQMLIILNDALDDVRETLDYNGGYRKENGEKLLAGYEVLKKYGWSCEKEDEGIIDGTSGLYVKERDKDETV